MDYITNKTLLLFNAQIYVLPAFLNVDISFKKQIN